MSEPDVKMGLSPANGSDWYGNLEHMLRYASEQNPYFLEQLVEKLQRSGVKISSPITTPYVNTIPPDKEPVYPGNREIERKIKSYVRWNAMAMVVKANRVHGGLGKRPGVSVTSRSDHNFNVVTLRSASK